MARRNKNLKHGPVFVLIVITLGIALLSLILSLVEFQTNKTIISNGTLETTIVTVNNLLSIDGLRYLFGNVITNFQMFEPLVLLLVAIIGIGICEKSGLLYTLFSPLKKLKFNIIIFITIFIGIISTVIGDYSYIFLIPIIGVIYKYLGKNPVLGILIMFIAITVGYGTELVFSYNDHVLGMLTQASATLDVDPNYGYSLFSYFYVGLITTFVLSFIGTFLVEKFLVTKFTKKYNFEEEIIVSKKAKIVTLIVLLIQLLLVTYMILPVNLPMAGLLLDSDAIRYIDKLMGVNAPFGNGLVFIIAFIMVICGFVYGKITKNIKNGHEFSLALSKNFENLGFLFVLMFFISQIAAILDWTNIGEVISCGLVEVLGTLQISGIILIVLFIIFVIIMSLFITSSVTKWEILSPTIVPLFMRSNISPGFAQYVFRVSDSIGKSLNPIYPYFIIMLAFLEKYRVDEKEHISIFGVYKLIIPVILLLGLTLIVIVGVWFLIGLPIGIGINSTL